MSGVPNATSLSVLLARARTGDADAQNALLRAAQTRLEDLARRMLRRHLPLRRWVDTGDVVQNATLRLLRALESTPVAHTREFFNVAAAVIRRELLDLARHFYGPEGIGANHATPGPQEGDSPAENTIAHDPAPAELEHWATFHGEAERLPDGEREVFGLAFYHGLTQTQIAEALDIDVRTVRRRWRKALETLHAVLGGQFPDG